MQDGGARDKRNTLKSAAKFKARGEYAQAAALLEEQIRRAPDVELLTAADELVFSGSRAGEFGAVLSLTRTLWSFLRAVQGDGPQIVERATTVMLLAERVGQDELARQMADYVLRARRGYLPDRHPELVLALNDAARLHLAQGDVDAARPLYEELAGSLPGEGPQDTDEALARASAHYLLGELSLRLGEVDATDEHWNRSLAWAEHVPDSRPLRIAAHLGLGRLSLAISDRSGAAHHLEQAYEQTRLTLGTPGKPAWLSPTTDAAAVAAMLFNLGIAHRESHDLRGAERALQEAIDLYSALARRESVADAVVALGHAYQAHGAFEAAERHFEHALAILDGLAEPRPQTRLRALSNLGALREQEGRLDEAGSLFDQAARFVTRETSRLQRSSLLNNRGRLAFKSHRDREAARFYQEALDVCREDDGDDPGLRDILFNLAEVQLTLGDTSTAVSTFQEGLRLEDAQLSSMLRTGSQREWLEAVTAAQFRADQLLDMVVTFHREARDFVELAADVLLSRAGLATTTSLRGITFGGGTDPRINELRHSHTELSRAIESRKLAGPPAGEERDHGAGVIEDRFRLEAMESELSTRVLGGSGIEGFSLRWRQIAEALPADTALVDLRRYASFDYASADRTAGFAGDRRYAALVLHRDRPPAVVPLGAAEEIDAVAVDVVAAFSGLKAADDIAVSAVREAVIDPLLPQLEGVRAVLIAPDGELDRFPFEAVPLGDGRLVMDEYEVSYLASARDVLRIGAPLAPAGPSLVVADPDLDLRSSSGAPPKATAPAFGPLPGARAEAEHIAGLLGVVPLLGSDAMKGKVTGAPSPSVLHVATHGYFLPTLTPDYMDPGTIQVGDIVQPADKDRRLMVLNGTLATPVGFTIKRDGAFRRLSGEGLDDPMLRSGLAFAGANTWLAGGEPPPEAGNGVLTAADLAAADLSATRLVVLSACDTALGETRTGVGVFGMRRAVSLAGARTLVMSLWKVPDKQTRELMTEFYAQVMAGAGVVEALTAARGVQRLKYPHPIYWAAFVCQGDPGPVQLAPLEGEDT
ncbi:CHAT domain-containing protein [Streptomyces sp. NPDC050529]|uniref:CHAT domain-containing protein n=1 Tax=Streptomyces sp. NPDC050529 TaxID=3365624 RepID=UPI0037A04237